MSVSAKGARKPKSKFLSGSQLFTYSDFVLYEGPGARFYALAQVDVIEGFHSIRHNFERLCYACYFMEVADKALLAGENCDDILRLILKALTALTKERVQPALAARVFEFSFLAAMGYLPELYACGHCGEPIGCLAMESEPPKYYFSEHGTICPRCRPNAGRVVPLSANTLFALRYILENELNRRFAFTADERIRQELQKAAKLFMTAHIGYRFKSLELLPGE